MKEDFTMNNDDIMITLSPIGRVVNAFDVPTPMETIRETESEIVLKPELVEGLKGIEVGDQVMVLFHFHLSAEDYELSQHPRRDMSRPARGVFALCSPNRPNRIGTTVVDVLEINGNRLRVKGLDAINGTPVIDLKPANRKGGHKDVHGTGR